MGRIIYKIFLILTILRSFSLQDDVSSEEVQDSEPDFLAIEVTQNSNKWLVFKKYKSCKFYYSISQRKWAFFFNEKSRRWEIVEDDVNIDNSCKIEYSDHSYYYKEKNAELSYILKNYG